MYIKDTENSETIQPSLSGIEVGDNNIALSIDHQGFHIETKGRWTGTLDDLTMLLDRLATLASTDLEELPND